MSELRTDGDRVVLATTLILAVISVVLYFIVYLTLFQFQMLNDTGRAVAVVAMMISALAMLLACFLALTNRGRSLASPGLSGLGWILVCGGSWGAGCCATSGARRRIRASVAAGGIDMQRLPGAMVSILPPPGAPPISVARGRSRRPSTGRSLHPR